MFGSRWEVRDEKSASVVYSVLRSTVPGMHTVLDARCELRRASRMFCSRDARCEARGASRMFCSRDATCEVQGVPVCTKEEKSAERQNVDT